MVGDSMLGRLLMEHKRQKPYDGINPSHAVDIGAYRVKTTEDMIDLIKPALRRNPAKLIVMSGTNDFEHRIDTIQQAKNVIRTVREVAPTTKLALTEICTRRDQYAPAHSAIADINNRLRNLCRHEQVELISTQSFDGDCLSRGRLHPNDNGNEVLKNIFNNFINK